ncbi:NAD(P)/FAD-dependent oxidoreductase [Zobellia uliginosa]|uniref:NAD(P)/FAD-dependent oxidoreductase n=1 Tax=Zobellia uliginosa TaxID=143224 RepID=UPI001C06B053|nr:FAD/NAD(P)-binding oxidoreductase [Zobellia uliginosa]MBU2946193.1 NAD(P)/FAD-dependent oxidoreductase [Zobellia uliginosa]
MSESTTNNKNCVVIGASHAGVNFAFALRREGWQGSITMVDIDPTLPYHRPPLSKAYLTSSDSIEKNLLKSEESYVKENINLKLGVWVDAFNRENKKVVLADGTSLGYDKLVIATGARPIMPPIPGLDTAKNSFALRSAADVANIRKTVVENVGLKVVVIGGGYIGLETAASLKKMGAEVVVLERESRTLARVTAPEMSLFFQKLHAEHGVAVLTEKNVVSIESNGNRNIVVCSDGTNYEADMIVVGVGIHVNKELAEKAGLTIENGIQVNEMAQTSDKDIYAIGDCTFHHNPHYKRHIRLESVQNAVDQAKIAAAAIIGKDCAYDALPWFWSDQYDVKLQMVGLSQGYDEVLVRKEADKENCFSVWYFKGDTLLAVDAVNNAKAYVYGTKFIKGGEKLDKSKLSDPMAEFKPVNLIAQ